MVVIVVDLSEPSEVLSTALKWIGIVKSRLSSTYQRLQQRGSKLPEQLRVRAKKALYGANEDKEEVYHSGISLIIAATKYDTFVHHDAELRKVMFLYCHSATMLSIFFKSTRLTHCVSEYQDFETFFLANNGLPQFPKS